MSRRVASGLALPLPSAGRDSLGADCTSSPAPATSAPVSSCGCPPTHEQSGVGLNRILTPGSSMRAEIISIGSELTSGQNLDTNTQWLSRRLAEMGIPVLYPPTVADDLDANLDVFRAAVRRADLVIATGGLGPTQDDLTRDVLAQTADVELVLHEPSLRHIEEMFSRRKRVMTERN